MNTSRKPMLGKRFGKLVVVAVESLDRHYNVKYLCDCDCGNTCTKLGGNLRRGASTSCGCETYNHLKKHQMTSTPEYRAWTEMKRRCYDSSRIGYKNYGARGIAVCKEWIDSFENFYSDMGKRPDNTSLDRIDNNGDYCPDNCRWATAVEQNVNKRNTTNVTYKGETLPLSEWAKKLGVNYQTFYSRIKRYSWDDERKFSPSLRPKLWKEGKASEYIK